MISEYNKVEYFDGTTVPVCLTNADTFWSVFYFLVINTMFYLGPFVLLIFMYSVIARHLMADPGTNCSERAYNIRARKQVVAMLVTVVVAFFLCLLPFRVFTLWIILAPNELLVDIKKDKFYQILLSCRIMLYVNSAVNPMLYNLMSSKFRQGFKRMLPFYFFRKRRCSRSRNNTLSTTITHSSSKVTILGKSGSSLLLRKGRTDSLEGRQKNGFSAENGDRNLEEMPEDDSEIGIRLRDVSAEGVEKKFVLSRENQDESFV